VVYCCKSFELIVSRVWTAPRVLPVRPEVRH
jgi:hypothetical protein